MERIERTALSNLIHNEEYTRRVLPFIKEEYFSDRLEKILFSEIYKFLKKTSRFTCFKNRYIHAYNYSGFNFFAFF